MAKGVLFATTVVELTGGKRILPGEAITRGELAAHGQGDEQVKELMEGGALQAEPYVPPAPPPAAAVTIVPDETDA